MSRHAAPRAKRLWGPLAAVVAGALLVAGGLWLSFDPNGSDEPLRPREVVVTGTPSQSGRPAAVKPSPKTPRSTPSTKSSASATPPSPAPRPSTPTRTTAPPKPRPSAVAPTVRPSVTPTPSQTASITYQALYLINGERKEAGAAMVAVYSGMGGYCQDWAEEMDRADTLVHSPHNPYSAEVIASGATSASQAVELWMQSPPHREIILNPAYHKVGIGYSGGYWCAVFDE